MRIYLWIVFIGAVFNIFSNRVVERNFFQEEEYYRELRGFDIDADEVVEEREFSGFFSKKVIKSVIVAGMCYTIVAGIAIVHITSSESNVCLPKFHEIMSQCCPVCYDY